MLEIVQYTKVNDTFFFFLKGSNQGFRLNEIEPMVQKGAANITIAELNKIVGAA